MPSSKSTSRRKKPEPAAAAKLTRAPELARTVALASGQQVVTERELNRATLARQLLLVRSKLSPVAAIEQLAGLQAQIPKPPFIGLASRLATFSRADLHRLILDKAVVRATMMRAAIHLVTARDYIAWRPVLQHSLSAISGSIAGDKVEGIDLAKLTTFALTKLPCTFAELRTHLAKNFPELDERALGYAVRCNLPLVLVPTETQWSYAGNAAFACAATWLDSKIAREAAADDLVLRYLAAFGPATMADARVWSAIRDLGPVFERLRDRLVTFRDDRGRELFDLPDAPRPPADTPAPVRFLPDYDNLMLAHGDRRRIVDDEHRDALKTKNLIVPGTFLVDGRIAGTWSTERKKASATLTLAPFSKLAKSVLAQLEEEGDRTLRFIEPDATSFAVTAKR